MSKGFFDIVIKELGGSRETQKLLNDSMRLGRKIWNVTASRGSSARSTALSVRSATIHGHS